MRVLPSSFFVSRLIFAVNRRGTSNYSDLHTTYKEQWITALVISNSNSKKIISILHELAHLCQLQRRKSSSVLTSESGGRATHTAIELSFHLESHIALATRNRFSSGLAPLLELNLNAYHVEILFCNPSTYTIPGVQCTHTTLGVQSHVLNFSFL